ncbi:PBP1A family penicillin-binding protein [Psychrobacillus glaciei]|uniref:PBP1A family penicillin-binding protein n=1 Tax=Psychrobacillus glaciei TaxID=2283160 RepID=A0A5J6SJ41_9BACI|nr:PBP1A family penicillin-binding protein [Psychrobacillus glaciei]QFF97891.1 PBP1A family penicillin-binding protein [Psychrobacillus glaciei]
MRRVQHRKKVKRSKRMKRFFLLSIAAICALSGAFVTLRIYAQIVGAPIIQVPISSVFLDNQGNVIGDRFEEQRRYWVSLDEMSPFLSQAAIAVEDKDFYKHHGFDFSRIASALLKDVKAGKKVEGASTITQQYARNLFLTHEKSWNRKINEALFAYRLEIFYEKEDLLEGYLNTVYFGHGMYGVEAASRFYFGKSAKNITLSESALLMAIPKGPSHYSPLVNEKKAVDRQQLILKLMEDQQFVTTAQRERAKKEKFVLKAEDSVVTKKTAPYFLEEVWKEASEIVKRKGLRIEEGGWTIETTLNRQHQQAAEEVIEKWMPEGELQIGFISMEPKTGYVTAMVGGRSFAESPFNRVTQAKRQPGSTIKPLLYAAALENGFSPLTYMDSERTVFTYDNGRREYEPKNVNGEFAEHPISLAQAIAISDNIYAVKTFEQVGYKPFQQLIKRFNIDMEIKDTPATALGTSEVSLFDMTKAYNTISDKGIQKEPTYITKISNNKGKVIYDVETEKTKEKKVLLEQDAFMLSHLLTGMFDPTFNDYSPATGNSIRSKQTRPYAAKSGTTNTDQYIIGFSPQLTAGVWNGYDQGKQVSDAEAKQVTKQVWIEFMEKAHQGLPVEPFIAPPGIRGVIVDIETGGIATSACKKQRLVYLKEKDVPTKLCTDPKLKPQTFEERTEDDHPWSIFPFSLFGE